ncbi:ARM repeat-containing protein [Wolfiporia cocos MD-104 SS10]|uniref:ARM repeat-containing protein n=1 Tax=Wolfiporia cocos (strain MD-104) TaxID=742152 RepID=A0A2H3J6F7_WOLCO|nr:ARM repeat-containing protein [Wolfiporia cocos MD-104 SS10]
MDVPFVSSGAISRAHYALVRKIETASSPQLADQYLLAEVDSIREQLTRPTLSLKQCRECLIILLYCSMNADLDIDLAFALPHAVNLAEAGQSVQEKRIGYLFCAEVMPEHHELQLMLVNTIRKDLESATVSRICLALETLIQFSTEDVVPAIRNHLTDLLAHNSLHIRRRALLAFHRLSRHDPGILSDAISKVRKRLTDQSPVVVGAALTVSAELKSRYLSTESLHSTLSQLLATLWQAQSHAGVTTSQLLLKVLAMLRHVQSVVIFCVIKCCLYRSNASQAMLLQLFMLLPSCSTESLLNMQQIADKGLVQEIRHLLTSADPNENYIFFACLDCVHTILWAGTDPRAPAALEEWEVERVMQQLDSSDKFIRQKVLRILQRVDGSITEGYYSRMLQGNVAPEVVDVDELSRRMLEVIETVCNGNGELYAQHVKNMLQTLEGDAGKGKRRVLQAAVEDILVYIRNASDSFKSSCVGALFTNIIETERQISPTFIVILAALAAEYLSISAVPPIVLLRGFCERIASYVASVQDACLLCMLRIAAECTEVPADVIEVVRSLHDQSGRYIRRRCDQFMNLSLRKGALRSIVLAAKSTSLPDFMAALEAHESGQLNHAATSPQLRAAQSPERSVSRSSQTSHKLRYDAYEPPKLGPRLRRVSSNSSRTSDDGSSKFIGQSRTQHDALTRTLTPGDLALAAREEDLESLYVGSPQPADPSLPTATRVDLITLDSPFVSEPVVSASQALRSPEVESIWNRLERYNSRGWCELSVDAALERLQDNFGQIRTLRADEDPFKGELKIVITSNAVSGSAIKLAVLRLKASDEDSCLWRMRCEDTESQDAIKRLLSDA